MPGEVWLPPRVSRELRGSMQARNAELREMFWWQTPVCQEWSRELQKIDPYLRLAHAKPDAQAPGVMPGFYHLVRLNPSAPLTAMPLHHEGRFVEPSSGMLDRLRESDLQNAQVVREQARRQVEAERAREREKAREDEERKEEIRDRLRAAQETSVSMNEDTPWSQNASATARRDARERARKDDGKV
jgi:hypothetical protein